MAVTEMGLTTLGITFGYGVGSSKPASFTQLERIVSISELAVESESIDVSCLEDFTSKFKPGRGSVTDSVPVTINLTDETEAQWDAVIAAYNGKSSGESMWFEIIVLGMTKAAFFKAAPPAKLPVPSMDQNAAFTATVNLTVEELVGWDTKVAF